MLLLRPFIMMENSFFLCLSLFSHTDLLITDTCLANLQHTHTHTQAVSHVGFSVRAVSVCLSSSRSGLNVCPDWIGEGIGIEQYHTHTQTPRVSFFRSSEDSSITLESGSFERTIGTQGLQKQKIFSGAERKTESFTFGPLRLFPPHKYTQFLCPLGN